MKYTITESRMSNLIKKFIHSNIVNQNKIKWVDDIEIHHLDNDNYLVEIVVNRKETAEMSAGFTFAWNNLSDEIKRLMQLFFNKNTMVTYKIGK